MIGVLFPVAHEAAGLISKLESCVTFRLGTLPCAVGKIGGKEVVVAVLGMGSEWVERHLPLFLNHFQLDRLILGGYAGGLVSDLSLGEVVFLENFSSESPVSLGLPRVKGVCSKLVVATSDAKLALGREHGAQVVEMESEAVARLARERGIPLWVIRAISDTAQDTLPSGALAASFDSEKNCPRPFRLMIYLVRNPQEIRPFIRFVSGLSGVRKKLTDKILEVLR